MAIIAKKINPSFLLSYKILVPYIIEVKNLMAIHEIYPFEEDETKSKVIINTSLISVPTTKFRLPIITLELGAIQRDRQVINNIGDSYDVYGDSQVYGEVLRTNVNITVTAGNPLQSKSVADYLFWQLEWNKDNFIQYGITDTYFDYLSKTISINNGEGYQNGINGQITLHEKYMLVPLEIEPAIKEFEKLQNMAEESLVFSVPTSK